MRSQKTHKPSCCESTSSEQAGFIDPICGMSVAGTTPDLSTDYKGIEYHFCSTHCLKVFSKNSERIANGIPLEEKKNRAIPIGILGAIALLIVFFSVVVLANNSISSVIMEVQRLWYWVLLLAGGFGFQLGLFIHIRHTLQQRLAGATAEVAASGAVSTGSMIACCSHGLVNFLPFFGISAAAVFLARYQLPFILLGVFSNLIGVTIMVGLAQKNSIVFTHPLFKGITKFNMKILRLFLIIIGILAIGVSIATA
jgi:YHS domain-containing protein